ncbi:MAG: hypothetical protein IJ877_03765 [Candidatus Gastranaerophilales bacterium]|nr:hypothetical protein [Candidatus Gastranaerophilales bacterium]
MYIIELFLKLKEDFKSGKFKKTQKIETESIEKCEHLFVPIDSTGRILACAKCGELYKLKKGEINPFQKN